MKRGPGRPEIGGTISVSLGEELLRRVERVAHQLGKPRAVVIRELLDAALVELGR